MAKKQIKVTVQTEDRLHAINKLSDAILETAKALHSEPRVEISNCMLTGGDPAINIDTADKVTRTEIVEVEEDETEMPS